MAAREGDPCRAIAFAASTGGPAALERVFHDMRQELLLQNVPACNLPPVFVTQHLSAPFNGILAQRLAQGCGFDCAEAVSGTEVAAGKIYIAPDGVHLTVQRGKAGGCRIRLMQTPPVHFCRPAADPMLESLAMAYGENLLAVILTGMGKDGLTGCQHVAAAGGTIWIQDAPSSVVWGMPGAVAQAGLSSREWPLGLIGAAAVRWALAEGRI